MCPFCLGAAATWIISAGAASAGGLALVAAFRRQADDDAGRPDPTRDETAR